MTKQTTVRLPDELADAAEAVARVKGTSVNALIVESLAAEVERVRRDKDFTARAKRLLERDKELLDRLAWLTRSTTTRSSGPTSTTTTRPRNYYR